jgi:triacylglycerol esterase/lipase EstA (alpha/beta hydrolase family)
MPSRSSLARLLQVACLSQLALALAWLVWRWPASPWQALAGAIAIPGVAPTVLALELAIASRVNRTDPVPAAGARQIARAWFSETCHLFRTFYGRQPFRWRAIPDHLAPGCAGRTGVVLVHGFMCNRGFWNAWMRDLQQQGHAFVAVNLEPVFTSIDDHVAAIDAAVARVAQATGRAPVVIAHSMGGLAARAWWRAAPNRRPIAHLVTIGSPHRGTWLARFSQRVNGRQMRRHSDWLAALAADEARHGLPPTTCWYSNCDNVVFPASTATLPNADNRFVPGRPHVALAFDPQVRSACLELVDRAGVPSR